MRKSQTSSLNVQQLNHKEALELLLEKGVLNEDYPSGLTIKELETLSRKIGNPIKVYTPEEYQSLAEQNREPKQAILFIYKDGDEFGHFVGVFTDDNNVIHFQDSFGDMNPLPFESEKIDGRTIIRTTNAIQDPKTANCGLLALAFVLTHGKIKIADKNKSN